VKHHKYPQTEPLDKLQKLMKIDMSFSMWNARNVYRAGLLMTVTKEI
jgi:hypothetical protein